jgi:glycosyltransferase involved in cell wall biosynthesis
MHKKPVISICIPTYNREQLIGDCLDSVVSQINDNNLSLIEIIISDNASTDNTKKIVETYQQKYSNISYYRNDSNLGLIRNIIKVTTYAY